MTDPAPQVSARTVETVVQALHHIPDDDTMEDSARRIIGALLGSGELVPASEVEKYWLRRCSELLAERYELRAERDDWKIRADERRIETDELEAKIVELRAERDRLKAENARLHVAFTEQKTALAEREAAIRLDGEPEAFVWGSHDAVKRVQALGDERDALRADNANLKAGADFAYADRDRIAEEWVTANGQLHALLEAVDRHRENRHSSSPVSADQNNRSLYEVAARIKRGET